MVPSNKIAKIILALTCRITCNFYMFYIYMYIIQTYINLLKIYFI